MKEKNLAYKIGQVCGAIFIGSIGLGASAIIIATVVRLIIRMF